MMALPLAVARIFIIPDPLDSLLKMMGNLNILGKLNPHVHVWVQTGIQFMRDSVNTIYQPYIRLIYVKPVKIRRF